MYRRARMCGNKCYLTLRGTLTTLLTTYTLHKTYLGFARAGFDLPQRLVNAVRLFTNSNCLQISGSTLIMNNSSKKCDSGIASATQNTKNRLIILVKAVRLFQQMLCNGRRRLLYVAWFEEACRNVLFYLGLQALWGFAHIPVTTPARK